MFQTAGLDLDLHSLNISTITGSPAVVQLNSSPKPSSLRSEASEGHWTRMIMGQDNCEATISEALGSSDWENEMRKIDRVIADDLAIINRATLRIREHRTLRNTIAPINRLPNELLSTIFRYQAARLSPVLMRNRDGEGQRGWIAVTHVCRHWREVSLSTPTLWATPDLTHPTLALEMLRRSKQVPLTILYFAHALTPRGWAALNQVFASLSRIARLDLSFDEDAFDSFVASANLTQPAPVLERLRFLPGSSHGRIGLNLPQPFLANQVPSLTHVEFVGCGIPWESMLLCNVSSLTCLAIYLGGGPVFQLPTYRQLLGIFGKMPRLTKLKLSGKVLPRDREENSTIEATLPNLRALSISSATVRGCVAFLNRVSVPDCAIVELEGCAFEAQTRPEMTEESLLLAHTISEILEGSTRRNGVVNLDLGIDGLEAGDLVLKACTTIPVTPTLDCCDMGGFVGNPEPPRLHVEVYWDFDATSFDFNDVVGAILPSLSFKNLHSLNVRHDRGILPTVTILRFFAFLPNLTHLTVWGNIIYDLLPLLCEQTGSPEHSSVAHQTARSMAFPVLRKLELLDTDFKSDPSLLALFIDACRYRKEQRSAIDMVEMTDCKLSAEQDLLLYRNLAVEECLRFASQCSLEDEELGVCELESDGESESE
ncbi:hypothetical protein VNI00_000921 [Paramarasmius palmivorus]|uniref:F-box domain-containing protein n=1 Tax=Paramarasmius palmivorus TaxID=297713 RepID=A0AAW0E8P9_9AGAR